MHLRKIMGDISSVVGTFTPEWNMDSCCYFWLQILTPKELILCEKWFYKVIYSLFITKEILSSASDKQLSALTRIYQGWFVHKIVQYKAKEPRCIRFLREIPEQHSSGKSSSGWLDMMWKCEDIGFIIWKIKII